MHLNNFIKVYLYITIFFNSLALNASEYFISYRYVVKDAILYNESLLVSKSMKTCIGKSVNFIELPHNDSQNLNQIIKDNLPEFIDFLHKVGLSIEYKDTSINAQNSSTTILTLKTTCFKVDFNDYFAKISPLK